MISRLRAAWAAMPRDRDLPTAVQILLAQPLFGRVGSLLVGYLGAVVMAAAAMVRIGGTWPTVLLAANLITLLIRLNLLRLARQAAPPGQPPNTLRCRNACQAVGLIWAVLTTALACDCLLAGDYATRVLAATVIAGLCGGIASRNASTPRYAIALFTILLVPPTISYALLGPDYWSVMMLTALYLLALVSIVRHQYIDLRALIEAEQRSRIAQAQLAVREGELQSMFQNAAAREEVLNLSMQIGRIATYRNDYRTRTIHCGPQTRLFHGFPLDDAPVPFELWTAMMLPQDRAALARALGTALAAQQPVGQFEYRYTHPLHGVRHIETRGRFTYDAAGQPIGSVGVAIDVTERREAEAALAARESELRAIFRNAAAGVVEVDLTTKRMVRVNPVYCRMAGRTEAELLGGLIVLDVTHPDDWAAERRWDRPAEIGQTVFYERRFLHPDGTTVWAYVSACVTAVGPDGQAQRVVAVALDCTEQKATAAALRTSDEMLRLSLQVGQIAEYRNDYPAQVVYAGAQGRLMHGLPLGDEPIPFSVWFDMILPEDQGPLACAQAAAHAARQEITAFEYRFVHPHAGIRHIETRSRVTYDAEGKPFSSLGVAIDVTERRQTEARIAHLAHHDPLTALPNRALFGIRLDEAVARARRGEHFALLCLDLDRFKEVNDSLGHPIGDALLRAVTERLNLAIRPTDTVARLGGDEFALIQTQLERPDDAIALAERLLTAMQTPFEIEGCHIAIGTSIGIALAPDDGTDPEVLMRRADMALYAAKADGRGRYRLFERHMDADLQARRTLELDLRRALEFGEFELFYQPVVNVATGLVCGFEALLRWHHPTRGLVPPDRFIPLAEATGLLLPIGAWVLHHACAEAAGWSHDARIAVNLSAVQFTGAALVATVAAALRETGLDPRRLELEITETTMLQDTEVTLATLHELKALGVTIAMDDFGTGYSSLGYLQRFPFDKVKIDRSFTSGLGTRHESAAIVRAVIDLCRSLEMRTTAEGVETASQFATLAKIGCHEAQGYFFSPPRPAADIPAMIGCINEPALPQPVGDDWK